MVNNSVTLSGIIQSAFNLDHDFFNEHFYKFFVSVNRSSGNSDIIPVMVSDRLINVNEDLTGHSVSICGEFRSYNLHTLDRVKLILFVFVNKVEILDEPEHINNVFLQGTICKEPVYRETPHGRAITDIMLAVNRSYAKSDYIPCIGWGRNAFYLSTLHAGDKIRTTGRIQSREYMKNGVMMTAYEMSMRLVEAIELTH